MPPASGTVGHLIWVSNWFAVPSADVIINNLATAYILCMQTVISIKENKVKYVLSELVAN